MAAIDAVAPPIVPLPDAPPPAVPDALAVHIGDVDPPWGIGVALAEVNRHSKTTCMFCKDKIPNGDVRFRYNVSKSVVKFMHATCVEAVPITRHVHSKACLRHQQDFGLGAHADGPKLIEAIEAALPSL